MPGGVGHYDSVMESHDAIEQRITDAVASGELTPTRGVGEPLPNLDNDPLWWAKSFLAREQAAERTESVKADISSRIEAAMHVDGLDEARKMLESINSEIALWNRSVDDEHRLEPYSEIWLLDQRAHARP